MTVTIYSKEMQALQGWLQKSREAEGLTMRELAKRLDKPHSYIQKVESGERRLDVVEFIWYCKALNLDPKVGLDVISKHLSIDH